MSAVHTLYLCLSLSLSLCCNPMSPSLCLSLSLSRVGLPSAANARSIWNRYNTNSAASCKLQDTGLLQSMFHGSTPAQTAFFAPNSALLLCLTVRGARRMRSGELLEETQRGQAPHLQKGRISVALPAPCPSAFCNAALLTALPSSLQQPF